MAVPVPFAGEYPGEGCRRGLPVSPSDPSDRRTFLGFLSMHQGVDRRFEWTFMAPVCVRVAFIGGGQGEPSRWADRYSLRCACDTEAGIVANQNEKTARSTPGERHHGRCARPRQPITLHPRRGCAKRKPSRTISRPESRHSCTTSQTTSATGPRKRRFSNAPTRKR